MRFLLSVAGLKRMAPLFLSPWALAIACLAEYGPQTAWASPATATTLSITSGGNAVSSVAGGTVVNLTATVQTGATALTLGQVNFCDATAASCTDIRLLGTAQLTSVGTAVLRFRPGPGNHSYKAVFLGTLAGAASSSAAVALTIGPRPPGLQTTFTVATVGGPGATNMCVLTASVGTKGGTASSGTVSFLDTNNANSQLGTATLARSGDGFLNVPIPEPSGSGADAIPIVAVGDFNGDGKLDLALSGSIQTTILLGNGDGTFTAPPNQPQIGSSQVVAADFNGDGKLDLAVSPSNGPATILLGNGDGTFTATADQPQITADQLVAADFNGDGKLDLAALDLTADTVTILLGKGASQRVRSDVLQSRKAWMGLISKRMSAPIDS